MNLNLYAKRRVIVFAVLSATFATLVCAQDKPNDGLAKITTFLNTSRDLRDYSLNLYTSAFTGKFRALPVELETGLKSAFPDREFYIARMKVLIDPPYMDEDLIVFSNAFTGEVDGFVWAHYWLIRPSQTFENMFKGRTALSKEDAINQIMLFARLFAFANGHNVGVGRIHKGRVKVELRSGGSVFSILEVNLNKRLRFDRMAFTEPNGARFKAFV